jgi:hypothetical protein
MVENTCTYPIKSGHKFETVSVVGFPHDSAIHSLAEFPIFPVFPSKSKISETC